MRTMISVVLGLALLALPARGQELVEPVENTDERFTVSLLATGLQGAQELASETRFEQSLAYGGQLTWWPIPGVGVRFRALRTEPSIRTQDLILSGTDPDVWLVTAGVVARRPYAVAGQRVAPYFMAGIGAKRYAFNEERYGFDEPYNAPAVDVGLGIELGSGPVRVFAEGGHVFSELHRLGFWEEQSDWFYGAGVSLALTRAAPPALASGANR